MAGSEEGAEGQPVITTSEGQPGGAAQPDVTEKKGFLARLFGGRSKKPDGPVEQAAISTTPVPDQSPPQAELNPTPTATPEAHTTPEVVEPTPTGDILQPAATQTLDAEPSENRRPPSPTPTSAKTSGPENSAMPDASPVEDKAA